MTREMSTFHKQIHNHHTTLPNFYTKSVTNMCCCRVSRLCKFIFLSGLFFSIFNSMANPIVYTTLLPSYRLVSEDTLPKSIESYLKSKIAHHLQIREYLSLIIQLVLLIMFCPLADNVCMVR